MRKEIGEMRTIWHMSCAASKVLEKWKIINFSSNEVAERSKRNKKAKLCDFIHPSQTKVKWNVFVLGNLSPLQEFQLPTWKLIIVFANMQQQQHFDFTLLAFHFTLPHSLLAEIKTLSFSFSSLKMFHDNFIPLLTWRNHHYLAINVSNRIS